MPKYHFFSITVSNAGEVPLVVDSITFRHGELTDHPVSEQEMIKSCSSPAYSAIRIKNLLTPLRLAGVEKRVDSFSPAADAVLYTLPFINAGETVMRITPFPWLPVRERRCVISITLSPITNSAEKKVIDFQFIRHEYRDTGDFFRDPAKGNGEKK